MLIAVFAHIVFGISGGFFPSPHEELYAKLLASILLGSSVSLAIFLAIEIMFTLPAARRPTFLKRLLRPKPVKPVKPRVRPMTEELPMRFVSRRKRLRKLAEDIGLNYAGDILQTGEAMSPYRFAAKSLLIMYGGHAVTRSTFGLSKVILAEKSVGAAPTAEPIQPPVQWEAQSTELIIDQLAKPPTVQPTVQPVSEPTQQRPVPQLAPKLYLAPLPQPAEVVPADVTSKPLASAEPLRVIEISPVREAPAVPKVPKPLRRRFPSQGLDSGLCHTTMKATSVGSSLRETSYMRK